jgi:hypothetical protein
MKKIFTLGLLLASMTLAVTLMASKSKSDLSDAMISTGKSAVNARDDSSLATSRTASQSEKFVRLEARNRFRIARLNHAERTSLAVK